MTNSTVHIKSNIVNIKMTFLRSFASLLLKEDAVDMHLASSQPPTITLCNADRHNARRLFAVSLSPLSLSLSLSKNGKTLACRKLKVRDVTSGTVDLPRHPHRNFILTNRDERKLRDLTGAHLLSFLTPSLFPFFSLFSLRSRFFFFSPRISRCYNPSSSKRRRVSH